jgi:hypothetical protein
MTMPNWCANRVYLQAPEETIAEIKAAILNGDGDEQGLLQYLCPEPSHLADGEWYSWRVQNWGTKWEVQAEIFSESKNELGLWFDSAWAPPVEAFTHWMSQTQDRAYQMTFFEPGMMFCGEVESGLVNEYAIPGTVAEVQASIPSALDEEWGISEMVEEMEREMEETEDAESN